MYGVPCLSNLEINTHMPAIEKAIGGSEGSPGPKPPTYSFKILIHHRKPGQGCSFLS